MLVRVREGKAGIVEYLVNGQKQGRNFSRDELDQRVCIDGDLGVTELILDHTSRDTGSNYYHITLSFKEKDITTDQIKDAYNDYKKLLMNAYDEVEYNCYAEIHFPKIQQLKDWKTGEDFDRYPHVHMVIPRKNLVTNTLITPLGKYTVNERFHDAIHEKVNYKHNLSSPYDNPRSMQNKPDIISRYKGDNFKSHNKELRSEILDSIHDKDIKDWNDFKTELEQYGEVKQVNSKDGAYYSIKPDGADRKIHLKDSCFRPQYIEERLYREPRPSEAQVDKVLEQWVSKTSHEIKHIINGSSSDFRKKYYAAKPNLQKEMLNQKVEKYEQRIREAKHIRQGRWSGSNKFSPHSTRPRSITEIPNFVSSLPVGSMDDRSEQKSNGAESVLSSNELLHMDNNSKYQHHELRRLDDDGRGRRDGRIDVVSQLAIDNKEIKRELAEGEQLQEIKSKLQPRFLFESVKHLNVDPKKFPFYKEKDGFKIKFENRNLNVSDFLTKGLHLKWNEAKTTLFNAYQLQLENRLTKESENAIIFKPTIGQSDHYTVQDSINVFRYLVQKQELRDQTMGAIDKLRELADQANEIKPNFDAQSFKDLFKTQQQKQQQELHDKVYTIADLVPTKNLQKKEVTYKRADTGKDVMVDRGDRIRFMSKTPSDSDVLAGITMAAEKFGSIQLKGTDEFKKQVLEQAAKADLTVVFMPKELHEEFNLMKEELKSKNAIVDGDAMEQKDHNAIVNSGTNKEQQTDAQTNVQEQTNSDKPEPVTLVGHGSAPYKNNPDNKESYFVELSNGTTHWGVELGKAIEESGAKIGDEVSVERLGKQPVEIDKDILDDKGIKIGTEKAIVDRIDWNVEVLTLKEELEQKHAQNAPESTQESKEQQANTNAQANANVEPEHVQEQQSTTEPVKNEQSVEIPVAEEQVKEAAEDNQEQEDKPVQEESKQEQEQSPVKDELKEETVFEQSSPVQQEMPVQDEPFYVDQEFDDSYLDYLAEQEQQTQDSKVQFYEEIQKRVNSAETPQELESLRNELENDDRYRVMGDSYEELTNGETKLDPVIDKMIANKGEAIESEIAQEATQEVKLTTAPDELPKGLYRVNYVKDDQTNTLSVRVNGKAIGEAVPDRFIENLRTQSQFLSNFSTDEIKQGGLSYDRITDGSTATSISADETGMKFGSNSESQSNQNTNSDTQTHRRFV